MNGDRVGKGYLIYRDDGHMLTPTLFDDTESELPAGQYNFMPNSESILIVLPKRENQ